MWFLDFREAACLNEQLGWSGRRTHRQASRQADTGQAEVLWQIDGWKDVVMDGKMCRWMGGRMDMNRRADKYVDGWIHLWMD